MLSRSLLVSLGVVVLAGHAVLPAQQAVGVSPSVPSGDALVAGRVVDGRTGTAIAGAVVALMGDGLPTSRVLVDSRGRFVFRALPAGRYLLNAEKPGFAVGALGKTRMDGEGQPIDVRGGDHALDLVVPIWPLGSISGVVTDETGEPVIGANVWMFRRRLEAGHSNLSNTGGTVSTDDRGVFRVPELWPGDYLVAVASRVVSYPASFVAASDASRQEGGPALQSRTAELAAKGADRMGLLSSSPTIRLDDFLIGQAESRTLPLRIVDGRVSIYPYTFHPSARAPDAATFIHLDSGEQRADVNIRLALSPTSQVSGIARGPDGPIANLAVRLRLATTDEVGWQSNQAETITDATGAFRFFGVPEGKYVVTATVSVTAPPSGLWAAMPVTVGGSDLEHVEVILRPTLRVSGRVEFDGLQPPSAPVPFRILMLMIEPAAGGLRFPLRCDADGTFRNDNLVPGKYFVRFGGSFFLPNGSAGTTVRWEFKSATLNGRDVAEQPLTVSDNVDGVVVTLSDRHVTLTGSVRDAAGAADSLASVVIFPVDPSAWTDYGASSRRLQIARADRGGVFAIEQLPPGEYYAVAIPDAIASGWRDPKFLERAAALATRVRITDADASIDLRTRKW